jgi:hypothetical protein
MKEEILRSWLLCVLLAQGVPIVVHADVLVVPVVGDDDIASDSLASLQLKVERMLSSLGLPLIGGPESSKVLGTKMRSSERPSTPRENEAFHTLAMSSHEGLSPKSDIRGVLSHFAQLRDQVLAAPETWNVQARRRDTNSACLGAVAALARASWSTGTAVEVAMWCMYNLDLVLDDHLAPPQLMPVYGAAAQRLAVGASGPIAFDVVGGEHCQVLRNGVIHDPQTLLYHRPYSFVAKCEDGDSRVHVITPTSEEMTVEIDLPFERALLETPEGPRLRYASSEDVARRYADAEQLAQLLSLTDVILLRKHDERVFLERSLGKRITLSMQHSDQDLERGLRQLMQPSSSSSANETTDHKGGT